MAVLDEVARAFQCPDEGFSKAIWVVGIALAGFLHDKVGQEPFIAPPPRGRRWLYGPLRAFIEAAPSDSLRTTSKIQGRLV